MFPLLHNQINFRLNWTTFNAKNFRRTNFGQTLQTFSAEFRMFVEKPLITKKRYLQFCLLVFIGICVESLQNFKISHIKCYFPIFEMNYSKKTLVICHNPMEVTVSYFDIVIIFRICAFFILLLVLKFLGGMMEEEAEQSNQKRDIHVRRGEKTCF